MVSNSEKKIQGADQQQEKNTVFWTTSNSNIICVGFFLDFSPSPSRSEFYNVTVHDPFAISQEPAERITSYTGRSTKIQMEIWNTNKI